MGLAWAVRYDAFAIGQRRTAEATDTILIQNANRVGNESRLLHPSPQIEHMSPGGSGRTEPRVRGVKGSQNSIRKLRINTD